MQWLGVRRLLYNHTRPTHETLEVRFLVLVRGLLQFTQQRNQSFCQVCVELQVRTRHAGRWCISQGRVHLAAAQVLTEYPSYVRLEHAKFFRHPKSDFQVTVVD